MKTMITLSLLLLSAAMSAQTTHTFTFGAFPSGGAAFQLIDGQPANQADGYAGSVQFPYGENPWWGLEAPQVWGFPNNGNLLENITTPPLGPLTFVNPSCNLKMVGCQSYQTGSSAFQGYGAGVTVDVTIWFVVNKHTRFGRGCTPCIWYTNDPTNGSGTATY